MFSLKKCQQNHFCVYPVKISPPPSFLNKITGEYYALLLMHFASCVRSIEQASHTSRC